MEVRRLNFYVSPSFSTGRISTRRFDLYYSLYKPNQQPTVARTPTLTTETDSRSVLEYNETSLRWFDNLALSRSAYDYKEVSKLQSEVTNVV
ncbi:hypothetical protein F511_15143 [Dorcoceras hygrometricum]|uniref:Uncharacterized protein n=1 Tax=Dorcoceras hygrometricum TaxID=472368 RepID=A0A2Z7B3V7_9LAMI|nr:hypothetical protein F511_15143 [Dorcoceras hygrometricum]